MDCGFCGTVFLVANPADTVVVVCAKTIQGIGVDACGRCVHYHSDVDVVGNKCAECGMFWACFTCHELMADHPFGRMPLDQPAVLCGVCGLVMDYGQYSAVSQCPRCQHAFNPGCSMHRHLYFLVEENH